jgi:hypothetical protein
MSFSNKSEINADKNTLYSRLKGLDPSIVHTITFRTELLGFIKLLHAIGFWEDILSFIMSLSVGTFSNLILELIQVKKI